MIEIKNDAVLLYVALLKERFGNNLPRLIRWAKMDLEWNASEGGESIVDEQLAVDIFKSNLNICDIEEYFS
jgi:hypothetical protein